MSKRTSQKLPQLSSAEIRKRVILDPETEGAKQIPSRDAMIALIELPKGTEQYSREELYEWIAINLSDFNDEISLIWGILYDFVTPSLYPFMGAGPKYQYYWRDDNIEKYKKPKRVCAAKYFDLLLKYLDYKINDPVLFPINDGQKFPKKFKNIAKDIIKRIFRAYAFIYYHCLSILNELNCEAHINNAFKKFIYFSLHFDLINEKEMKPLRTLIQKIMGAKHFEYYIDKNFGNGNNNNNNDSNNDDNKKKDTKTNKKDIKKETKKDDKKNGNKKKDAKKKK